MALDSVSGVAKPGEILAIMGASGSGKTTLLNIICHRHDLAGKVQDSAEPAEAAPSGSPLLKNSKKTSQSGLVATGEIFLNGQQCSRALFRSYGAYVTQEDRLLRTFSPKESIAFTGSLRLPKDYTDEQRASEVESIITQLRLEKCADTPVGDFRHPGVSGGERKRTAIGVEMISNPSVLCLDEPTSGLDSFTALKVVEVLKDLAKSGRTIILTIHQPSVELFELFDSLLILSSGKTVYFGPAQSSRMYFMSLGMQCPVTTNPADCFLRLIENQLDDDDDLGDFYDAAAKKDSERILSKAMEAARTKEYLKYCSQDLEQKSTTEELPLLVVNEDRDTRRPLLEEVKILGKRAITNYWRQMETTAAQITQVVFCSLVVGLLFFDIGTNQDSITSRKGALFEIMMNVFMLSFAAIACTFPTERPLFLKEKANNMYSTSTYFWSKVLIEFSFQSIWPIVYMLIVYYMVGFQNSSTNFLWFIFLAVIVANVASAFALLLGALVAVPEFTMQMVPFAVVPFTLFTALFISEDSVPTYYVWMQWISPFHYAYECFCIIEFIGLTFTCTTDEMVLNSSGDYVCPYSTGLSVLEALGIDPTDFFLDLMCLIALYVVYLMGAYGVLCWRKEKV